MRWRSVGTRLTAWYLAVLVVVLGAAAAGVWVGLRQSVNRAADRELTTRLRAIEADVARAGRSLATEGDWLSSLSADSMTLPGHGIVRVRQGDGPWLYQSADAADWPVEATALGSRVTTVVHRRRFRAATVAVSGFVVQVAVPLHAYDEVLDDFFEMAGVASPILLLVAAVSGYWLSRRALRPVDEITEAAQRISTTIDARLPVAPADDELRRLSMTLNAMLDRLEAEEQRARQFTADASHELRTPVAVLRATADVTLRRSRTEEEHQAAWRVALHQVTRLSGMIDGLLRLARAGGRRAGEAMEPLDLAEEVRDLCQQMGVVAAGSGLRLACETPAAVAYHGDVDALRAMTAALLDNAIKYTPSGGAITVRLVDQAEGIRLEVHDTGPGIPASEVERVFDRFYRVSKDRSRETGGAGLGLAIVRAIARQHGGDAAMTSDLGAGCHVVVSLPHRQVDGGVPLTR